MYPEPQPQDPGVKPIKVRQCRSTFPVVVGHIMGCRGRARGDCTGFTMGYLGKEPKAGKGMDLGDLRRNNGGENRGVRG